MAADDSGLHVSRRRFVRGAGVAGLGLLVGCGRLPGQADPAGAQPRRTYRVGILSSAAVPGEEPVRDALRGLGYIEGDNLVLETRLHTDPVDAGPQARDLVARRVDVIVTFTAAQAKAASEASGTIPIVNIGVAGGDLVETGLAEGLARPGRNVTGLTTFDSGLVGKRLQLLSEIAPGVSRLAVLWDGASAFAFPRDQYTQAADRLGVHLQVFEPHNEGEVEHAFEALSRERAEGLEVRASPTLNQHHARIVDLALQQRLPTIGESTTLAHGGLLMAYQPRPADLRRRAASYVDRILKGANPAEMPIERPATFDFAINLKTAEALGLTIPQHVLLQATEIIQ
jgi:putative ABC transport system substrate-binding protein